MDFRNFMTHAAERRRAGAILGSPPPVDGKRNGVHHWFIVTAERCHYCHNSFSRLAFNIECPSLFAECVNYRDDPSISIIFIFKFCHID